MAEQTCQWDESGDDLEKCDATDLIPIKHRHTDGDGVVTESVLGQMCAPHALRWMHEHTNIPKETA